MFIGTPHVPHVSCVSIDHWSVTHAIRSHHMSLKPSQFLVILILIFFRPEKCFQNKLQVCVTPEISG